MSFVIGRGRYARAAYPTRSAATSSTLLPLSAQFWVDSSTTVPLASRNGSIAAPFGSLQAAYDAAITAGLPAVNILVARSLVGESLNCTGAIVCSVVGMSGTLANAIGVGYQQQVANVTASGPVALEKMNIVGDIVSANGSPISINSCIHFGDVNAPNSNLTVEASALCLGGGAMQCSRITFLDAFSEGQTLSSTAGAWAADTDIASNNAGTGANQASVLIDADEPSETFTGTSRRVWPAGSISAPRSVTLLVGGAGDFATGYVDVYPQAFDVTIIDGVTPGNLRVITAGTGARRYGFVLPNATAWENFSAEIL